MPLKYTNTKTALKILWTNEDKSRTATFTVDKTATEEEQTKQLLKAVGFLGVQMGIVPPMVGPVTAPTATSPTTATATTTGLPSFAKDTPSATTEVPTFAPRGPVATPPPNPAGKILMMPPASLSDGPAGGAPSNLDFWQAMPTTEPPAGDLGWEVIPEGER